MKIDILRLKRSVVILLFSYIFFITLQLLGLFFLGNLIPLDLIPKISSAVLVLGGLFFISNLVFNIVAVVKSDSSVAVNLAFMLVKMAVFLIVLYPIVEAKEAYYQAFSEVCLGLYGVNLILEVGLKKYLLE